MAININILAQNHINRLIADGATYVPDEGTLYTYLTEYFAIYKTFSNITYQNSKEIFGWKTIAEQTKLYSLNKKFDIICNLADVENIESAIAEITSSGSTLYIVRTDGTTDEVVLGDIADDISGLTQSLTNYLSTVTTDSTITGNGLVSDPLSIQTSLDLKANKTVQVTGVTVTTTGWTSGASSGATYYSYDINYTGITSSHIVDVIPCKTCKSIVDNAQFISQTNSATDKVTIYAQNPITSNITVTLNIFQ